MLISIEVRNKAEDTLWTRKYFMEFSNILLPGNDIRGRKLSMFISNETHKKKPELLLRAIKILSLKNSLKFKRGVKIIFKEDKFPIHNS